MDDKLTVDKHPYGEEDMKCEYSSSKMIRMWLGLL